MACPTIETIPRPKLRMVDRPPQGGRPRHQPSMTFRHESSSATTASGSRSATAPVLSTAELELSGCLPRQPPPPPATLPPQQPHTSKSVRPLPSVPQLHAAYASHSAPLAAAHDLTRSAPVTPRPYLRPLPRTPGPPPFSTSESMSTAPAMPAQSQEYFDIPVPSPADISNSYRLTQMPVLAPIGPLRFSQWMSPESVVPTPKESSPKSVKAPPPPLDLPPVGLDRSATPPPLSPEPQPSNPAPALILDSIQHETSFASFWTDDCGSTPVASESPVALLSPLPRPTSPTKEPTPPPTPPPALRSAPLPRPGEVDGDDAKATRLLEELKAKADRGHELIMLASQMSRMWCPTRNGSPPPLVDGVRERETMNVEKRSRSRGRSRSRSKVGGRVMAKDLDDCDRSVPPPVPPKSTPRQQSLSATCAVSMPMPSFELVPPLPQTAPSKRQTGISGWLSEKKSTSISGIVTIEDSASDNEDDSRATNSSMKFLETLAPSKRHTVLTIVSSIAEESVIAFRSMPDDTDTDNESDSLGVDGGSPRASPPFDPSVDRKATEIGYEFAKKTGKVDWAPKLVKRLSKKWVREKKGKRWVEDDYSDVLGFLRRL